MKIPSQIADSSIEGYGEVAFEDLFELSDIQQLQDEFAEATGVASLITRPDGTPITEPSNFCRLCRDIIRKTEKGLSNCFRSDAEIGKPRQSGPTIQPCMSGGLWDAGAGINVGGRHIANWLIGQVRDETQTEQKMRAYARDIGADETEVVDAFREIPSMSREQFEKVAQALFTLARHLSDMAFQNVRQSRTINERKQTEKALHESETRLRLLLGGVSAGFGIEDLSGRTISANEGWAKVLGYTPDELLKMHFTEYTHPDYAEEDVTLFHELAEGKRDRYQVEKRYIAKNGREVWGRLTRTLVRDEHGNPEYCLGLSEDITERKRTEEALRKSEERFSKTFFASPVAMAIARMDDGLLRDVNHAWLSMLGYSHDEVVGKTVGEIGLWRDPDARVDLIERVKREGSVNEFEAEFVTKDRRERTMILSADVLEFSGKQQLLIAFYDVTERKIAEAELVRSEAWFRALAGATPMAIGIKGLDRRFVWANEELLKWLGTPLDGLIGKTTSDIRANEYADEVRQLEAAALRTGEPQTKELEIYLPDGGKRVEWSVRFAIFDDENTPMGFGGVAIDISERRAMESQLLQAQKMETVGQLTGGVAHDFNNLLQVVQGNLEMAKDTIPQGSKAEELVNGALRAGHRGAKLTQQLLAFSRKQTLRPENLDAHSLVNGMTSLLARTLGEDISIETQIADGIANVIVDENGLTNALLNLALNARAAMPTGGTLTVTVNKLHFDTDIPIENDVLPTGDYIEIAVSDTGAGMSVETLDHAFEPFFTTKEVGEGSGLGLSMVYGFARQSGGNATIESKSGKGTTVRLVLPAATGATSSTNEAHAVGKDVQHAIKVLLVEDDADVRDSTVMLLKSFGCEVVEADNAEPVPGILEQDDSIDLLFSDVVLPGGKNGIDLAQDAVRQHPGLKVILVSGYPEGTLEKAGLSDTEFRLLSKPYAMDELSDALASVMAR
ncbi:MAG: PAS domain S-box protein [Rhodospirillales bacterium]|nr:PAS domain S-box protein [Rhodospirillales bacterium]